MCVWVQKIITNSGEKKMNNVSSLSFPEPNGNMISNKTTIIYKATKNFI